MLQYRRILVPVDFSPSCDRALNMACTLATEFQAELHLLYVKEDLHFVFPEPGMPTWGTGEFLAHQAEIAAAKLAVLPDDDNYKQLKVVRQCRDGSAGTEITNYAVSENIDLIVMGTHGRGIITRLVLGSVAAHVVRTAPCPVMTVCDRNRNSHDINRESQHEHSTVSE